MISSRIWQRGYHRLCGSPAPITRHRLTTPIIAPKTRHVPFYTTNDQLAQPIRSYHGIENNRLEPSARIKIVPLFTDNYAYLLIDEANLVCAAVDPADADSFIHSALADSDDPELTTLLCTHKHWDHAGGNEQMAAQYKGLEIYGPATEDIPAVTNKVKGGDKFTFGGFSVDVLDAGCHTRGHIMFYVTGDNDKGPMLFAGDTLFVGGVGRFFEGNAQDMYNILYGTIAKLPPETLVYCGHEYTMKNLAFALTLEPDNEMLNYRYESTKKMRDSDNPHPTVPTTIGVEMQTNPFLRVHLPSIASAVGLHDKNKLAEDPSNHQETAKDFVESNSDPSGLPSVGHDGIDPVEVMARVRQAKDSY